MHRNSVLIKTQADANLLVPNQQKNIQRKLYRTNAAIWYKKTYRQKQLTPTYVNISINGKNQQCQKTLGTANQYRINQEIKFLYTKKN